MSQTNTYPQVIQGGMGVGVSNWRLANAVSRSGQLGVVSGSMLDTVMVRRLQDGDADGSVRRAAEHFPIPDVAERIVKRYFRLRGRPAGTPYKLLPMYRRRVSLDRESVTMLANFIEVWLAKEGHSSPVGINLLTKVQFPNLASLYGAMLAGVDYVIMGAGIPREIPGVLDAFAEHRPARLRLEVEGIKSEEPDYLELDPMAFWTSAPSALKRPRFLGVVSAASLAATLARKSSGTVDGFVVETSTAGGHNAPPRGPMRLNDRGEPLYGERDIVDLSDMRALGLPFWIAGGMGSPESLAQAQSAGAQGIQVGTLFAFSEESGISPKEKRKVLDAARSGEIDILTDPRASPTGYPFKVVKFTNPDVVEPERERICDLGYLRVAVRTEHGLVYRCPAEPVDAYVAKGGDIADTVDRRCLCNGLTATIGLGQVRGENSLEPPLITSGDQLRSLGAWLAGRTSYHVSDVLAYLLGKVPVRESGSQGLCS